MGGMEQGGKQALEGGDICIYTADSLCCIAETNRTIIIKAIICVIGYSVMSNSLQPHGPQRPLGSSVYGDSPGKNTGVG